MSSRIAKLSGATNGVNTVFTTPSKYITGTIRLVLNGQIYESDDEKWGWSEIDDLNISMVTPPRDGDSVQAFYEDKSQGEQIGVEGVTGSPFDPNNILT